VTTPLRPSFGTGTDQRIAGGELIIDIDALKANYRALARLSAPAVTAGVVKANAYGLGLDVIVPALLSEGCQRFFVAMPDEGIAVRSYAPDAAIFVLSGLYRREVADLYAQHRLTPVLNSPRDVSIWEAHCGAIGHRAPCAVHVDTGMNRLGMTVAEALSLAEENSLTQALDIALVMSHLACADQADHPLNAQQLQSFQQVRAAFPGVESSLANSAAVLFGKDFHHEMTRPGIALYAGLPVDTSDQGVHAPVVTVTARVVQLRTASAGVGVGYGATPLARDSRLAVAAIGYADGYPRALSSADVHLRGVRAAGGFGFLHGRRVPVIGRVTMDLTIFDVTDVGADVQPNDQIELIGPNISIHDVAAAAGTIPYEILTSLGSRFHRRIVGA